MTETDNPSGPTAGKDGEVVKNKKVTEEQEETGEISDGAKALAEELEKIKVEQPTRPIIDKEEFDPKEFQDSYKENLPKEKLVLAYGENFRRQYVHLYRDRKPLFLNPINECGMEKFVCTTIRPTQLPYQELYDWDGTSEFVSDYLNFIALEPPYELPSRLLSPTTILRRQKGNCFEYSTLLCSLLIGAGYDAYVVSGYATKETCLMDETREICPLLKKKEERSFSDPPPALLLRQRIGWGIEREKTRQSILEKRRKMDVGGLEASVAGLSLRRDPTTGSVQRERTGASLLQSQREKTDWGWTDRRGNREMTTLTAQTEVTFEEPSRASTANKQVQTATKPKEQKKYTVKPPKDLQSKFELKQQERSKKEIEAVAEKKRIEAEKKLAIDNPYVTSKELEQPPTDPLYGLRIHSWVLVLEGKREVPESFFIEPFTGIAHPITSPNYLGIESVWNHMNYWVNMQDCSEGVKNMRYDLGDCTLWEFMFPSNEKPLLNIPDEEPDLMDGLDEDEKRKARRTARKANLLLPPGPFPPPSRHLLKREEEIEKHLDMPPSWVQNVKLDIKDFQMRCPMGKKTKFYKRAKLEKFAHYLMKDGLVCRLSVYDDKELSDLMQVKEFYEHRKDKLQERLFNQRSGWVTEYYKPGRGRSLKEHHYKSNAPGPENERTMIFYHVARVDGLMKRVETPVEMTEHFTDRSDHLFFRHVQFSKRPKKFGPAETSTPRPIVKMIERYHADSEKEANETIAEIVFNVADEKIQIMYHTEENKISASGREFTKPPNSEEKGATLIMTPDMHSTFQVDPMQPQKKQVDLYNSLSELLKAEDTCREHVRESEDEVQEILNDRTKEESMSELDISVYDTMRNEKAKKHRKELERLQLEEKLRKQEMELDYLAPFLAQIGNPEKLTRQQAFKLKEDCLADLKQRLIDKANLIQARFEKETQELQKKQAWYQQNQVSMMKDDEEEYLSYCSDAMFRIHILELRLNRHKESASQKYMNLEHDIRTDTRLCEFF